MLVYLAAEDFVLILVLKEKGWSPVRNRHFCKHRTGLNPCSEGERMVLLIINPLNIIEQSRQ